MKPELTAGGTRGTNVRDLPEARPIPPEDEVGRVQQGVRDMAHGVAASATDAVDAVKETAGVTADAFNEAVESVKDAAKDTGASLKSFFGLSHPWLVLGGAALLGLLLLALARRNRA